MSAHIPSTLLLPLSFTHNTNPFPHTPSPGHNHPQQVQSAAEVARWCRWTNWFKHRESVIEREKAGNRGPASPATSAATNAAHGGGSVFFWQADDEDLRRLKR
ncbi:hypothetical protein Hanom_Chr02g00125251 [Helianthus anomalus]